VVEAAPQLTGIPEEGLVEGRGTEAATLEQAQIERAVGLVAGTADDATNLSIIMTALEMNRHLYVVARQNHVDNDELFARVGAQVVMHPSMIVADGIRVRLTLPLLWEFVNYSRFQDDAWACALIERISALLEGQDPLVWQIEINGEQAAALAAGDEYGSRVTLDTLLTDPRNRVQRLPVLPLLLEHNDARELLPEPTRRVRKGDQVLFCGREWARGAMGWTLQDPRVLRYVLTGQDGPDGWVWRRLARQRRRPREPSAPI